MIMIAKETLLLGVRKRVRRIKEELQLFSNNNEPFYSKFFAWKKNAPNEIFGCAQQAATHSLVFLLF